MARVQGLLVACEYGIGRGLEPAPERARDSLILELVFARLARLVSRVARMVPRNTRRENRKGDWIPVVRKGDWEYFLAMDCYCAVIALERSLNPSLSRGSLGVRQEVPVVRRDVGRRVGYSCWKRGRE